MNELNRADEEKEPTVGPGSVTDTKGNNAGTGSPDLRGRKHMRHDSRSGIERRAMGLQAFFTREVWSRELASLPTFRRWGYTLARVAHLTVTNFIKDRCSWRAAALTYITVLSLVPMLALAFSVAKGLGAYETLLTQTIVPFLDSTFGPADAPATELVQQHGSEVRRAIDTVLGFVQKTDVSRLGALGLMIVVWTVIQLLGAIEKSFNDIWGVTKARSLPRKLADYLSTVVLVPLLLVTGTGVLSLARGGWLDEYTGGGESPILALLSSVAVIWVGFACAYILMPNTRVRVTSALVGGVVGGTMWQLFQFAHLKLQIGVANYNAIYSTFAALPIFLIWVHFSWMTVLAGAEAAAAHQNQAHHGQLVRSRNFDLALKETIALRLVARVTRVFLSGGLPRTMDDLAEELGCPERTLEEVAHHLEHARILAIFEPTPDEPALILASDPDRVRMQDVFDALRGDALDPQELEEVGAFQGDDAILGRAFLRYRTMQDSSEENLSLRELVEGPR